MLTYVAWARMHMRMPPRPAPRGRDARQHAYDMSYFALKRLSRKRGHVGPPPAAPLKATPPKRTFSEAEAGDDGRAGVEAFLLWCEGVGIGLHPGVSRHVVGGGASACDRFLSLSLSLSSSVSAAGAPVRARGWWPPGR